MNPRIVSVLIATAATLLLTGSPATASVLWNNGTGTTYGGLITNPGAGFNSADASQASADLTSTGTTCSNTASLLRRVGDDFTVPASGWTVTSATAYAYLQGTYATFPPTSPMTTVTMRIFNQLPVDDTTGLVASTSSILSNVWSGIYITQNGAANLSQNNKPAIAATLDFGGLSLGAGSYWLTWTFDGQLGSGTACIAPYLRNVDGSGLPTTPTGDAILLNRNSGIWNSQTISSSRGGLELPFLINGTAAPAPGAAVLLGLGALGGARRRRTA